MTHSHIITLSRADHLQERVLIDGGKRMAFRD